MDASQETNAGFTPHVMHQIHEMTTSAAGNVRGSDTRQRNQYQHHGWHPGNHRPYQHQPSHTTHRQYQQNPPAWTPASESQALDMSSFPPLGASRSASQSQQQISQHHTNPIIQQTQIQGSQPRPNPHHPQETYGRGRANHFRGNRSRGSANFYSGAQAQVNGDTVGTHDYPRPQPTQRRLYTPNTNPYFGTAEHQRATRHKIMAQSDFLSHISTLALKTQITQEEYQAKESFRRTVQALAQTAIFDNITDPPQFDIENVKLRLYGSLGSGFGVAGSDMDLLLTFPQTENGLGDVEIESRRWLEKALLDAGYGARLLTNTRVPILKVCEKPSSELLKNLCDYRQQWEEDLVKKRRLTTDKERIAHLPPATLPSADILRTLEAQLFEAIEIPLPEGTPNEQVKLEFSGDCGIQCDINFTNFVALRNTELLKVYGLCDPRVRQVGLFIKHWAKSRDINTPYKGTLSSYGYIMMVLHYLMNIANPPIIPNLQLIARDRDAWEHRTEIETIEGFDVRFIRDPEHIQNIMMGMAPNHESVGSLLRGFFWYYACNGGYHWTRDAISIRTHGGLITKQTKGWTGAKWSENKQNVRLRYLLAIEDPFETEHNIGRTVGHSGIVAIRDEFRRAWFIIDNVQLDEVQRVWYWNDKGTVRQADTIIEAVAQRGDLLRKDHEIHKENREKIRQLKQEADAREKTLHEAKAEPDKTTT